MGDQDDENYVLDDDDYQPDFDDEDGDAEPYIDAVEDDEGEEENEDEEDEENEVSTTQQESSKKEPEYIFGNDRNLKNNFITKFEYASLIGNRAIQIEESNPPVNPIALKLIQENKRVDLTFSLDIAKFELDNREIPFEFYIFRRISVKPEKYEVWEPRELIIPHELLCKEIFNLDSVNVTKTDLEKENILKSIKENCSSKTEEQFQLNCKKFSSYTDFM